MHYYCFRQASPGRTCFPDSLFGGDSGDLKLAALLDEDGQLAFPPARICRLESHIYQGTLPSQGPTSCEQAG